MLCWWIALCPFPECVLGRLQLRNWEQALCGHYCEHGTACLGSGYPLKCKQQCPRIQPGQDEAVQEAAALWRSTLSPPVCGFLTVFWHFSLKLECDKLASEKSEMQRHYVMVRTGPAARAECVGGNASRCLCLGSAWQGTHTPQSSRALSRAGIGFFLKMGLFCVGCMQGVVEMRGGREFFDVENGARRVIDGLMAWLPVPKGSDSSCTPQKVLQGAGVQVFGDSGKVMASERQSSALGSHETGKPHQPGVS